MAASKAHKRIRTILIILIALTVLVGIVSYFYVRNYYHASSTVNTALENSDTVTVEKLKDDTIVFMPEDATAGFIFYQGGKVEYTAYAPLLHALAENGILCILPQMPSNLAVFDINAADGLREQYPEITRWYIGGHSLGGAMSASYVAGHADTYDGLILLAAYSSADLSQTDLSVLSIYGSNDEVLDKESYAKNRANLPEDTTEYVIDGGCHSYFGSYGSQKGDGIPTISNEEQISTTVDYIMYFVHDACG